MCKTIKLTTIEPIECDNCGEVIETGEEAIIDIHLIEGTYFFCSIECAASEHGEQLTEEEERRQDLLQEYGIGGRIDELCPQAASK